MFLNLRRNRIKLMYWDTEGIAIRQKKQQTEDTHYSIVTEVGFGRTFKGIVDESRCSASEHSRLGVTRTRQY